MKNNIKLIDITLLKQHEKIRQSHLDKLMKRIEEDGYIKNPIIADKNTLIILDGHHRFNAMKLLGLKASPVYLVDYNDDAITVTSWKKNKIVTKDDVRNAGLSGKLLTPKTSRHHIPKRPLNIKVPLDKLRNL